MTKEINGLRWKIFLVNPKANFLYNRYKVWKQHSHQSGLIKFWLEVKRFETKKTVIEEFLKCNTKVIFTEKLAENTLELQQQKKL